MRHPIAVVCFLVATLAACATGAQRQYQGIRENSSAAGQQLRTCARAVYDAPSYEPLRRHIPFDAREATLQQMTDTAFVTDAEIALILDTHPQLQACRQAYIDRIGQATPSMVPIFAGFLTKTEHSLIDLIQKKKPWGEHVRYVKEIFPEFQAQVAAEDQRIIAGLNQDHQAELAQRQRAAAAFSQYMQTQQIINSINRPVYTNCNRFGNTTNCVSQ